MDLGILGVLPVRSVEMMSVTPYLTPTDIGVSTPDVAIYAHRRWHTAPEGLPELRPLIKLHIEDGSHVHGMLRGDPQHNWAILSTSLEPPDRRGLA
jgi:hypothetical protein